MINFLCADTKRFRVFDPATTLYCLLFQVLNNCSGKVAIGNLNLIRAQNGLKHVSMSTAALVKAKKKLAELKLKFIACSTGRDIDRKSQKWFYQNRHVYLGDGTVVGLDDTKANRKEYPATFINNLQQGQPKMRLMGIFSATSGAFLDGELGAYCGKGQGETTLIRSLISRLQKNSILVLDRLFTSYFLQCELRGHGCDYVIRARDESASALMGKSNDCEVIICRSRALTFSENCTILPERLKVRYVKSEIKRKGFRTARIFILTSMLKSNGHSREDIESLYLKRWSVELDIRHLKSTMFASLLKSKTPDQSRKEMWVHLIAYNMVRLVNINCALQNGIHPLKQGFKIALKLLVLFQVKDYLNGKAELELYKILSKEILNSPYRREPRALKKRHNRFPLLTSSRKDAQKESWGYSRRRGISTVETAA